MWAGIQKNGIVFLNTNPHCTSQLSDEMICRMGIGRTESPQRTAVVQDVRVGDLVQGHEYGAKVVFMVRLMSSAPMNFSGVSSPFMAAATPSMPKLSATAGTPIDSVFIIAAIQTPRKPHTTRGAGYRIPARCSDRS